MVRGSVMYFCTSSETNSTSSRLCDLFSVWVRPGRSTTVSWGLPGPDISMLNTSLLKAPLPWTIPIASCASSINRGRSPKFSRDPVNSSSFFRSFSSRLLSGRILTTTFVLVPRRRTICVAKRVQRLSLRGKGISVIASRTEDFPED
jgi:hypothetical protein